jgi:hypothetical protein
MIIDVRSTLHIWRVIRILIALHLIVLWQLTKSTQEVQPASSRDSTTSTKAAERLTCPGQLATPGADQYELWLLLWFSSAHILLGVNWVASAHNSCTVHIIAPCYPANNAISGSFTHACEFIFSPSSFYYWSSLSLLKFSFIFSWSPVYLRISWRFIDHWYWY